MGLATTQSLDTVGQIPKDTEFSVLQDRELLAPEVIMESAGALIKPSEVLCVPQGKMQRKIEIKQNSNDIRVISEAASSPGIK